MLFDSPRRRLYGTLIFSVISLSFVLLLCEFGVRYLVKAWPFEKKLYVPSYLTPRDASLRWRFSAANGRNSLGLRNREVVAKKKGIYRILFLGDSLVWSGETSLDDLYTAVLERRLNARSLKAPRVFEVINAGIPGYTTYQELEFLRLYGLDMEPDLVILGFVFNDLHYKYLHKPTKQNLLDTEPSARLHRFHPRTWPGLLLARSYLAHEIVARRLSILWKKIRHQPVFPFDHRTDFYLAWKDYAWAHEQELIGMMKMLLMERHIPLLLVSFPVSDQVNARYRQLNEAYVLSPQRRLRVICNTYDIPMLDLTGILYRNGGPEMFRDYLHLNAKGNDLIVNAVLEFLVAELSHRGVPL